MKRSLTMIALITLAWTAALSAAVGAVPMMTPVPSEMMVTVFHTVSPTGTATMTPTATPTPLPPVCLEITRRTGVRQWPSLWSVSLYYLEVGTRVYAERVVSNRDTGLGPYPIPSRLARLGQYAYFAVEVRGTGYAKVCP